MHCPVPRSLSLVFLSSFVLFGRRRGRPHSAAHPPVICTQIPVPVSSYLFLTCCIPPISSWCNFTVLCWPFAQPAPTCMHDCGCPTPAPKLQPLLAHSSHLSLSPQGCNCAIVQLIKHVGRRGCDDRRVDRRDECRADCTSTRISRDLPASYSWQWQCLGAQQHRDCDGHGAAAGRSSRAASGAHRGLGETAGGGARLQASVDAGDDAPAITGHCRRPPRHRLCRRLQQRARLLGCSISGLCRAPCTLQLLCNSPVFAATTSSTSSEWPPWRPGWQRQRA